MGLQSGMIEFEVDQTQLQRIELKLKDMKAKAPQALKNAVNATARDAKKDLADKAKETYAVIPARAGEVRNFSAYFTYRLRQ